MPSGADLVTPVVADRGRKVTGGMVGQLFEVRSGDRVDMFVLTGEGLASVTPLQAALRSRRPETRTLTPGEFAALVQARQVRPFASTAGLPAVVPELLDRCFRRRLYDQRGHHHERQHAA